MDMNLLTSAVREGNLQIVRNLVHSFDLSKEETGYDLLLDALERNHRDIAKLLLLNDSKVNSNNEYSITPLHFATMHGDIEIIKMLIDRNARIDSKDIYGQTSLYHAIEKNQIKIVNLLLHQNAFVNVTDRDGITPLHIASKLCYSDVVNTLLNYGAYINPTSYLTPRQKCREGYTPLHYAVENDSQEITKLLLENKADANIKALRGTPLHIAAEEGYPQIVEELLNHRANINCVCISKGYMPLHLASTRGNTEVVRLLLNKGGADVNAAARDNLTPLYLATEKGYGTIVKLLLEHGADVNVQDKYINFKALHGSLLHIAAQKGYQQITQYLLDHGASLNSVCTSTGYTPLHIASANGSMDVIDWILSRGADVNAIADNALTPGLTPLYIATLKEQRNVVKLLLEHGADVNTHDRGGKTVLHYAVECGYTDIIEDILMFCPDLNNEGNQNALIAAICSFSEEYRRKIVENLLQYGFKINSKYIKDSRLLYAAIRSGFLEIVECLLQNGADVNKRTVESNTPLHTAIFFQREEIVKLLVSYGADVNVKGDLNKTPLCLAIENRNLKLTRLLLINGANLKDYPHLLKAAIYTQCTGIIETLLQYNSDIDINACDKFEKSTLLYIDSAEEDMAELHQTGAHTRKENEQVSPIHFDNRAMVNSKKEDGTTALHIAACGDRIIVEMLLKYGAEVDSRDKYNMTPLHVAARKGNQRVVETLLKFGADIDSLDEDGKTALHIACEGRQTDAVIVLLQNGIDINITSEYNLTALDFAMPGFQGFETRFDEYDSESDVDDDEIYCRRIDSSEKIVEILLQHLVKMTAEKSFVNEQYLHKIDNNMNLKHIYDSFKMEIREMKNDKIGNTDVSFFEILTRDVHQLAIYAGDKHIVDVFDSCEYKKIYPRYADELENQFKKGKEREGLLKSSKISFNSLFGYELPHVFISIIFSYLSNFDLKNLIDACPYDVVGEN